MRIEIIAVLESVNQEFILKPRKALGYNTPSC